MADMPLDLITLPDFLAALRDELQADPVRTLREACDLGLGHWLRPEVPCSLGDTLPRRPATHLHEITLLGVNATGDTERAAAAHWLTVARRLTQLRMIREAPRGNYQPATRHIPGAAPAPNND